MAYRVEFAPSAARDFKRLPKAAQLRVRACIDGLAVDPRPQEVEQLSASEEQFYRVREGDYRVVYQIQDDILLVLVMKVGHRREVYRRFLR